MTPIVTALQHYRSVDRRPEGYDNGKGASHGRHGILCICPRCLPRIFRGDAA